MGNIANNNTNSRIEISPPRIGGVHDEEANPIKNTEAETRPNALKKAAKKLVNPNLLNKFDINNPKKGSGSELFNRLKEESLNAPEVRLKSNYLELLFSVLNAYNSYPAELRLDDETWPDTFIPPWGVPALSKPKYIEAVQQRIELFFKKGGAEKAIEALSTAQDPTSAKIKLQMVLGPDLTALLEKAKFPFATKGEEELLHYRGTLASNLVINGLADVAEDQLADGLTDEFKELKRFEMADSNSQKLRDNAVLEAADKDIENYKDDWKDRGMTPEQIEKAVNALKAVNYEHFLKRECAREWNPTFDNKFKSKNEPLNDEKVVSEKKALFTQYRELIGKSKDDKWRESIKSFCINLPLAIVSGYIGEQFIGRAAGYIFSEVVTSVLGVERSVQMVSGLVRAENITQKLVTITSANVLFRLGATQEFYHDIPTFLQDTLISLTALGVIKISGVILPKMRPISFRGSEVAPKIILTEMTNNIPNSAIKKIVTELLKSNNEAGAAFILKDLADKGLITMNAGQTRIFREAIEVIIDFIADSYMISHGHKPVQI